MWFFSFSRHPRALLFSSFGLTGLAALLPATAEAADSKIAIVDMQRAVSETADGSKAIEALKKLSDKRETELNDKRAQLTKEKADLDRKCQNKAMAKEACERTVEELQRKLVELQNLAMKYQTELQKQQGETMQPLLGKMLTVVRRVAQRDGYDMIVDKAVAHYQRTDLDLTEVIVKMYNAESSGKASPATGSGAKPAAPGGKLPAGQK